MLKLVLPNHLIKQPFYYIRKKEGVRVNQNLTFF